MIQQFSTTQLQQLLKAKAAGINLTDFTETELITELEKRPIEIIQDEQADIESALKWRKEYIASQYELANTEQNFI